METNIEYASPREDTNRRIVTRNTAHEVAHQKPTSSLPIEPKTPQEKLLAATMRASQNAFYRQIHEVKVVEQAVNRLDLEFPLESERDEDSNYDEKIIVSPTTPTEKIGRDPLIEALKQGLTKEYEFLFSTIQRETAGILMIPVSIILGIKAFNYNDLEEGQRQQRLKQDAIQLLKDIHQILGLPSLINDDEAEKFTVRSLRETIQALSNFSSQDFLDTLAAKGWLKVKILQRGDFGIPQEVEIDARQVNDFLVQSFISQLSSGFLTFQSKIVNCYQRYFDLADQHLEMAKKCGVNLTEEDVDVIRCAVYEKIKASPNDFVSAFVQELMKAYAQPEYAEVRDSLFLLILNEANAAENSTNQLLGNNQPIDLQEQAEKTLKLENQQAQEQLKQLEQGDESQLLEDIKDDEEEDDGEQVTHQSSKEIVLAGRSHSLIIASTVPKEMVATCQLFAHVGEVKDVFRNLSCASDYTDTKQPAIAAARGYINEHREDQNTTLEQLNAFYKTAKAYINRHKNPIRDSIFGLVNTASWQVVAKEIRVLAFQALQNKLSEIEDDQEKINFLTEAKNLPLFHEHRHNYVITGAWGRTDTVAKIDALIENIQAQLNTLNQFIKI